MKQHTDVSGSNCKRVMACPGSVHLCKQYPEKKSNVHADRGTLLHDVVATFLDDPDYNPRNSIGAKLNDAEITEELYEEKIVPAINLFNDYFDELERETEGEARIETERYVEFGNFLPDVGGTCDVLARVGKRAIVLDWKFGDGVAISAERNHQLMFYAAAAMRTADTKWAFKGTTDIELVIIQPPFIKRWVTNEEEVKRFEAELKRIVKIARGDVAETYIDAGEHCKFCRAKDPHPTSGAPLCPVISGGLDRIKKHDLSKFDPQKLGLALTQYREIIAPFGDELERLVAEALEGGLDVPGWKLVQKRATRQWIDEKQTVANLLEQLSEDDLYETKLKSPAQMEKLLKKNKMELPEELVQKVSSGTTIAPESDPRPAVLRIGKVLSDAVSKLV